MDVFEDYNEWYQDNRSFIVKLHEEGYPFLSRFHDVFKVLHHIEEEFKRKKQTDDELLDIFDIGFGYLNMQILVLKSYYEEMFRFDMKAMVGYADLMNYSFYLDEFSEILMDQNEYEKRIQQTFESIQDRIDAILSDRGSYDEHLFEEFDALVGSVFGNEKGHQTVGEIFSLIAEELSL